MNHFYATTITGMSITLILSGFCSIIFNTINLRRYQTHPGLFTHGIWGGCFLIITGIIGLATGSFNQKRLMKALMAMCIITALVPAPIMLITSGIAFAKSYYSYYRYSEYDDYFQSTYISSDYPNSYLCPCDLCFCIDMWDQTSKDDMHDGLIYESLILILSVISFFVSIIATCLLCHGIGGCSNNIWIDRKSKNVVPYTPILLENEQPIGDMAETSLYNQSVEFEQPSGIGDLTPTICQGPSIVPN